MPSSPSLPGAGRFFLALLLFGVVYFLMPPGAQPWFALVIVLGALVYAENTGAVSLFADYVAGPYRQTSASPSQIKEKVG